MRGKPFGDRAKAGCGRGKGGFTLPEVLCAVIILSLSILASFSAMSYALTLTNEGRNRMNDFSLAMSHGVAFNIWAEDHANRTRPSPAGLQVRETSKRAEFNLAVGGSPKTADGGRLWLDVTAFETSFDAGPGKKRLLSSPVFVIFSRALTADDQLTPDAPRNIPR
jgi:prepilin-type N-terminal cleavage/methylation domain-containing protein